MVDPTTLEFNLKAKVSAWKYVADNQLTSHLGISDVHSPKTDRIWHILKLVRKVILKIDPEVSSHD